MMNLEQPRELEGNLKVFKFPEVLQFLSLNLMTGVLSMFQDERRAELAFKEGKIVSVFSNERYMRLGTMLVAQGRVTQKAMDEALESQEATRDKRYLGEILIERGLIDAEELKRAISLQIEEELWELFSWDSGMFRFEQGLERAPEMATVELDVAPLLQEGARRMEEWRVLCSQIDKPTEVLMVNPDFPPRPDPPLDEKTWRVLSLVNGRLNVQALVRFSNLGKFETYWALDRLLRTELCVRGPSTASRFDGQATMRTQLAPNFGNETIRTSAMNLAATDSARIGPAKAAKKGGLFSKSKPVEAPAATEEEIQPVSAPKAFPTDVALACSAVNRYLNLLMAEQDFASAVSVEPAWIEQLWRSTENLFPRADIIKVDADGIHCGAYDRLARLEGQVTRPLQGTHDDVLEALRLAWNKLHDFAASIIGERADTISEKAARPFVNCTATIRSPEFSFIRWKEEGFGTKAANMGR